PCGQSDGQQSVGKLHRATIASRSGGVDAINREAACALFILILNGLCVNSMQIQRKQLPD
ncbi:MAG: hypothetical protein RR800_12925, partial [Comamonas sp.]